MAFTTMWGIEPLSIAPRFHLKGELNFFQIRQSESKFTSAFYLIFKSLSKNRTWIDNRSGETN